MVFVCVLGAVLTAMGFLFWAQITINKGFRDAIKQFEIAIAIFGQKDENQKQTCMTHRSETQELRKWADINFVTINLKIEKHGLDIEHLKTITHE